MKNFSAMHSFKCNFLNAKKAFSLVEMLMTLLVASLLMAAMAPVMTKKMNDSFTVSGELPATKVKKHEITYGSSECPIGSETTDSDGSVYCEGTFVVPQGYNGIMTITLVGAGGGGGTAPTAGYTEFSTIGNANTFRVPALVNKVEATLVGGGAGGGAGGKEITTWEKLGGGQVNFSVPAESRNTNAIVRLCGAGGGIGVSDSSGISGGGSGAYVNRVITLPNLASIPITVGGAGGNAGGYGVAGKAYGGGGGGGSAGVGGAGSSPGGGGGQGNDINGGNTSIPTAGSGASGGAAGSCINADGVPPRVLGTGGSSGIFSMTVAATDIYYPKCTGGSGGYIGGGGGAGGGTGSSGGGGAATTFGAQGQSYHLIASGGGGGGGVYATGAGGGGPNGGSGGNTALNLNNTGVLSFAGGDGANCSGVTGCTPGNAGQSNWSGSAYRSGAHGATPTTEFANTYCTGGRDGAIRVYYATNRSGGTGGGGAAVVPYQPVTVTPNENLTINIADRANGGTTGGYNASGVFSAGTYAQQGKATTLSRSTTILLTTVKGHLTHGGNHFGGSPSGAGIPSGYDGRAGAVFDGVSSNYSNNWNGASNTAGRGANDVPHNTNAYGAVNSNGGRGGTVTIFGEQFCIPGAGGTSASTAGKDGGAGCGGGGGSRGASGGMGGQGYARISWNKYWDITNRKYDLASSISGGGGAAGNVIKYKLNVRSGEIIKFRIGKGGAGGSVSNNTIVASKAGGKTQFGIGRTDVLAAGGGAGGLAPSINGANIINGTGGSISNVCSVGSSSKINVANTCAKGEAGANAGVSAGGAGGNLLNIGGALIGTGGAGGISGTGVTNGGHAEGFGAGGGGAGLLDVDLQSAGSVSANSTKGGDGKHGKITIEWEE